MEKYIGLKDFGQRWRGVIAHDPLHHDVRIQNLAALQGPAMDELVYNAVFNPDAAVVSACRALIATAALASGAKTASIQSLYQARGRGEVRGFTVPAVNIRGMTYDMARTIFRVSQKLDCQAMIFELARSEIGYTFQRPSEYASCILAAAVREGFQGPVFLQGDHYQVNAKKFGDPTTREPELTAIRELCVEALGAGVLNIDIDPSTLVNLERPTLTEQQRENYELCAYYSRLIRQKQPKGALVSVGGEIGEVGTKNSTVEELRAFMQGYLTALGHGEVGVSKISVQSGTSHGGIPLAGGGVAQVKLDFKTLEELSKVARDEFGMAGAVQHGASTLPTELFHHFPKTETAEIHLATEFQNMVFDHPAFPRELKEKIVSWCVSNCSDERKPDQTDSQFLYKTRKKAWGPFKHELWTLPEKETILGELEGRFSFLWKQLNVVGSRSMVQSHVRPVPFSLPWPINFSPGS